MQKTKTRSKNGRKNGKPAPDLMDTFKRGPGRPRKQPTRSADQIAAELEAEAKKLQGLADILRGKA